MHNFSEFNKKNSWNDGDKYLVNFANFITSICDDSAFRVEGDDFMILSEHKLPKLKDDILTYVKSNGDIITCSVDEDFIENIDTNIDKITRRF